MVAVQPAAMVQPVAMGEEVQLAGPYIRSATAD